MTAVVVLLMVLVLHVGTALALGGGDAAAGAVTAGSPSWIALLAMIGCIAGAALRVALLVPVALVGMVASATRPLPPDASLAEQVAFAGIAALDSVAVTRWLRVPAVVPSVRVPPRVALRAAVVLAVAVAVAAALALRSDQELAYWLPMTVFLLVLPTPGKRLSQRAAAGVRHCGRVASRGGNGRRRDPNGCYLDRRAAGARGHRDPHLVGRPAPGPRIGDRPRAELVRAQDAN